RTRNAETVLRRRQAIRQDGAPPATCRQYWRRTESAHRLPACFAAKRFARYKRRAANLHGRFPLDRQVQSALPTRGLQSRRIGETPRPHEGRRDGKLFQPLDDSILVWFAESPVSDEDLHSHSR